MEAKELRIGNLIEAKHPSQNDGWYEVIVCSINDKEIETEAYGVIYGTCDAQLINCRPIPLTEEWLVKFGFEKKYSLYWDKNDIAIFDDNGEFSFELMGSDTEVFKITNIPYVHSLQNLYFCLTGEELVCV